MNHRSAPPKKGALEFELIGGGEIVAGVDEVGRGCLAGPVYAAAVVLDHSKLSSLNGTSKDLIRDSKTLSLKQRQKAEIIIKDVAFEFAIASAEVAEIEELGILHATFLAMRRCLEGLKSPVTKVLVDGNQKIPDIKTAQMSLVGGDSLCYTISAASILAKNARDEMMVQAASTYPHYGFERHVGYGTQFHIAALDKFGICPLHRKTFAPIRDRNISAASNQSGSSVSY